MRSLLATILFLLGPSAGSVPTPTEGTAAPGRVFQPNEGDLLFFCDAPGLSVNIKVDSVTAGARQFAMGTAELHGSNTGTHAGQDEIIFIYEGRGEILLGDESFPAQPGTTMYVPRGVRHGFTSQKGSTMRFVWVIAPQGLEKRFREGGVPSLQQCPPRSSGSQR
ncbi:MAG TPA: cupin domain-containing protein [Vicinamibacteria bacterium]|nr:cupin domain-containing protein [Vicinamibacteria bacterium]